jgi:AbrB family looped-hinge helix DNA binding protein
MGEAVRIGKRGTVVIPSKMRRRFGIVEGAIVVIEEGDDGIRIRPATLLPVETYSKERKAELLLENAVDAEDYERVREEVRAFGVDPDSVPHRRP